MLTSPVTSGAIAASHATRSASCPSSQAPPSLPVSDANARHPAHRSRTRAVHCSCKAESPSSSSRSASDRCTHAFTGCPARSGTRSLATSRRMASASASWYRCSFVRSSSFPAGAPSASSTRPTTSAHSGVRSPWITPAPPNVVASFSPRSAKSRPGSSSGRSPRARSYICAASDASSSTPSPPAAAASSSSSDSSRNFSGSRLVHRQISRPTDSETCRAASAATTFGWVRVRLGPGGVPDGGAPGDPGPVHQPRHRAVLRVPGAALPGGEPRQDRRPARRWRPHRPARAPAGTPPGSR